MVHVENNGSTNLWRWAPAPACLRQKAQERHAPPCVLMHAGALPPYNRAVPACGGGWDDIVPSRRARADADNGESYYTVSASLVHSFVHPSSSRQGEGCGRLIKRHLQAVIRPLLVLVGYGESAVGKVCLF